MAKNSGAPAPVSYEIAPNLHLVCQPVSRAAPAKPAETPINHIAVIDVSGSMSSDLPRMREQLKKKLPKLLRDGDTLSLIWFSGRGQFGALIEAEPVATLADLGDVHKQIDRWLRPVGMTGFVEPLNEVTALVARVSKKNKNPFALFFMSDGCDNQWDRGKVLAAVQGATNGLASSTFVEYGYYADRPLLAAMAAKAGGSLIFAEGFDKYEPIFEAKMASRPIGGKRIEVPITGDPVGGFVFELNHTDKEITTYEMNAGGVTVPEGTYGLWYLAPKATDSCGILIREEAHRKPDGELLSPVYAALSLFAVRAQPAVVFPILKALGDVRFIEMFAACFGKQKYSEFMDQARLAAFGNREGIDVLHRYVNGYNPNLVPPDDAFTVLDLLRVLTADESTRLLLDSDDFVYSRVSRGRVDADDVMTSEETAKLAELHAKIAAEKSAKKVKELQAEVTALLDAKRDALKFVADPAPDGYPISGLVYNGSRPNISMLVRKPGKVDLGARKPPKGVPDVIDTHIWRNYTLVRDGLVNIEKVPAIISKKTYDELKACCVPMRMIVAKGDAHYVTLDVKPLPIINRLMFKTVSAEELIRIEYRLLKAQAEQKVFNHYMKTKYPDAKLEAMAAKYSDDAAEWLKEQGITSNGWAPPHTVQATATDVYMGKELDVKIKGFSKLPSLKEVTERTQAGKALTGGARMMGEVMLEVETFLKENPANQHQKWLTGRQAVAVASARGLIHRKAEQIFAIIVGQTWPKEFKSLDDNTLTFKIEGQDVTGTLALAEIEIKI
jgi:hypothetical protein